MQMGDFQVAGGPEVAMSPDVNLISPGYFKTLEIKVRGRDFDVHDTNDSANVCVVNTTLAHRLAADGDVLGRSFSFESGEEIRQLTVIGITPDGRYASLSNANQPFLFLPLTQWSRGETSLVVKISLPANTFAQELRGELHALDASLPAGQTFAQELRGELHALDASLPAGQVHPLTDFVALSLLPQHLAGLISLALGGLGLLLAAIGLYGLIAMHIVSHTREFGVRLALGASPRRILHEVMRRGTRMLILGLAIGALLSLACAQLISSLLFGAGFGDVSAFAAGAIVLASAVLFACWLPARGAARIAPMEALRHE